MKIPKQVDTLLKRRTILAKKLDDVCCELDQWIDENNIDLDYAYWHTGVETYVNPDNAEKEVRRAIERR